LALGGIHISNVIGVYFSSFQAGSSADASVFKVAAGIKFVSGAGNNRAFFLSRIQVNDLVGGLGFDRPSSLVFNGGEAISGGRSDERAGFNDDFAFTVF
jgi:hypothetical protein